MGKSAPAAPDPPDPVRTANAQGQMNIETARAQNNMARVNQFTPQGSIEYRNTFTGPSYEDWSASQRRPGGEGALALTNPGTDEQELRARYNAAFPEQDRWEAITTLSPEQQNLYNLTTQAQATYGRAANAQLGAVEQRLSTPFAFAGGPYGDGQVGREAVEAALFERLNPQLERDRMALESRLANQGITMGSQAWQTGMGDFGRQANDARLGVIAQAGQEQNRLAALRQQSLQEQLALRGQPVNEASALLTGQQVQMPQFSNVPSAGLQAPDYQGAVAQNYAGQLQNWNAQVQQIGAANAAAGQILGSVAGAGIARWSDRRLKRDVVQIGTGAHGLPVYRWRYLWGEEAEGFMADEVAAVRPDAVHVAPNGYAMVDYGVLA
jgi:hypothetical protein